jgi:hypothetical protein
MWEAIAHGHTETEADLFPEGGAGSGTLSSNLNFKVQTQSEIDQRKQARKQVPSANVQMWGGGAMMSALSWASLAFPSPELTRLLLATGAENARPVKKSR